MLVKTYFFIKHYLKKKTFDEQEPLRKVFDICSSTHRKIECNLPARAIFTSFKEIEATKIINTEEQIAMLASNSFVVAQKPSKLLKRLKSMNPSF